VTLNSGLAATLNSGLAATLNSGLAATLNSGLAATLNVLPLRDLPEVRPGDDLATLLLPALRAVGVAEGDVVVVTSKIVSKAEGRLVPGTERTDAVRRETRRVVARRGDLVIAETAHGFVCANAGVDASNVEAGTLALLPEDPDGSARSLRAALAERLGVSVAVVITDTFGRAWRTGLVNVAIGCAGLPAVVDLRGTADHFGQELDATVVALADEVAAASGLVMAKAARVPAALVRGVDRGGAPDGVAADLLRPPAEDLFRESPLQALHARRDVRSFGEGDVPRDLIVEAVRAACTIAIPHHTTPWRFSVLTTDAAKLALRSAMAAAGSDAALGTASVLIVPWLEQERFLLSAGAAIQTLLLALHAQGVASCWIASTLFSQEEMRACLDMDDAWFALGTVACGPMPKDDPAPARVPIDPNEFIGWR
jgi:coenzyme F420-0:L-glutamate ligase/coenzyme F420-1:gamma-L-glutamate ligase